MTKVIGKKDLKKTHFKRLYILPGASAEAAGAVHRTALRGSREPKRSVRPLSQLRLPQCLPDPVFSFAQKYSKWQKVKQGEKILPPSGNGGEREVASTQTSVPLPTNQKQ